MRILVVDDDYLTRSQLKCLLSNYGDCDAVPNGDIGFLMFQAAHGERLAYDVITMDIDMPGSDGRDIVERIRKWEGENDVPEKRKECVVLMVSGKDSSGIVFSSFRKGCEGFIQKPATPEKLEKFFQESGLMQEA